MQAQNNPFKNKKYIDIGIIIFLFVCALGLRLLFQAESTILNPFIADAKDYALITHNIYNHGVYTNSEAPENITPLVPNIARPPGYPFFLLLFMSGGSAAQFFNKVIFAQALLSSLGVILIFILGRLFLSRPWATAASFFTACSPHLVAVDYYILSESLFIFTIILSVCMFLAGWLYQNKTIFFLAGILFGISALIKPISMALGPFVCLLFFFSLIKLKKSSPLISFTQVMLLILGCTFAYGPLVVYRNINSKQFSVSSQSIWDKVVMGADINMKNFRSNRMDPEKKTMAERMYNDKKYALKILYQRFLADPFGHLRWYLGGKLFYLWKWDSTYAGDVYQYKLEKKGFEVNQLLKIIHSIGRIVHWPLFLLTLGSTIFIFLLFTGSTAHHGDCEAAALVIYLTFAYFAIFMSLLHPLPRYGLPLRPFSYLLACYTLSQIPWSRLRPHNNG